MRASSIFIGIIGVTLTWGCKIPHEQNLTSANHAKTKSITVDDTIIQADFSFMRDPMVWP